MSKLAGSLIKDLMFVGWGEWIWSLWNNSKTRTELPIISDYFLFSSFCIQTNGNWIDFWGMGQSLVAVRSCGLSLRLLLLTSHNRIKEGDRLRREEISRHDPDSWIFLSRYMNFFCRSSSFINMEKYLFSKAAHGAHSSWKISPGTAYTPRKSIFPTVKASVWAPFFI